MPLRPTVAVLVGLAAVAGLAVTNPAKATELPPPLQNHGFENGFTGWTKHGTGAESIVTDPVYAGARSARLDDQSTTAGFGMRSPAVQFVKGKTYVAAARVLASSGKPDLYLRFLDGNGVVVATGFQQVTGTLGSWHPVQTPPVKAPENAVRMEAMIYSSIGNKGVASFDQVTFSVAAEEIDLGVQVDNGLPIGTTFGIGAQQHLAYGVVTSPAANKYSAKLAEIDVNTGVATARGELQGALGASVATTASDGSIYLGANTNGRLYRYNPSTRAIENLGVAIPAETVGGKTIPMENHLWSLAPDTTGRVYGGTGPKAGFFTYRPGSALTKISRPVDVAEPTHDPANGIVRGMVFDPRPGQQAVYLGVGYHSGRLIRYDVTTGKQQNLLALLPEKFRNVTSVTGMTFTGDRLFARIGSTMAVLAVTKTSTGAIEVTVEAELTTSTQEVSPVLDGSVYYVHGERLYRYDIAAKQATLLDPAVPGPYRTNKFALVELADQQNYPGKSVVAIGDDTGKPLLFKYNPATGNSSLKQITVGPTLPNNISAISAGPDGAVYSGGHLTGGLAAYEPMLGDNQDELPPPRFAREVSQIEGMTTHKGVLYIGAYPGARLFQLKPGTGPPVPSALPGLSAVGNGQERPYAITGGDGRVFFGTTPSSGQRGGALTVYDIANPANSKVIRNIVPNQSPVALAYQDGVLWGGTTNRPGYDAGGTNAPEAKLFSYHPETGTVTEYSLPVRDRLLQAITALIVVDGKLWGFAEGHLFIFDPVTRRFTLEPTDVFPEVNYTDQPLGGLWRDAALVTTSRDPDHVYGTIGTGAAERFFKINRGTQEVTTIKTFGSIDDLVKDDYENLYYTRDERLYRYVPVQG